MQNRLIRSLLVAVALTLAAVPLWSQGGSLVTRLRGFEEVPAISSPAGARFSGSINAAETELTYQINYFNVETVVTQSHIHFAQKGVNGGIVVFLCTNLGNGPAGTPACPSGNGTVSGMLHSADVVGSAGSQGIAAGEFFSLVRAIKAGIAYANVHSTAFPGGEVRGQIIFTPTP
jgi:hypothetical protein